MPYLEIAGGLLGLFLGGDALVRGAVLLAQRIGVSPLLIGLLLVGFGTSTPELVTSLDAALADAPGIAVGNVVGSNICNILLILGLAALVRPIGVDPRALRRDGLVMALAAVLVVPPVLAGSLPTAGGLLFLAALAGYVAWSYLQERRRGGPAATLHREEAESVSTPGASGRRGLAIGLALAAGGLAGVLLGADLLVGGALELSRSAGIPETVIGLTLVALGTSLPELAASLAASWRGHNEVAVGNIVGSNIFNLLGILGATALLGPLPVPVEIARLDLWVMLAATAALLAAMLLRGRLGRPLGLLFLGCYGAYVAVLLARVA